MSATHYTRSNGEMVAFEDMEHTHLVASRDKLIREGDPADEETNETVMGMNDQIGINELRFAAQRAELEAEGYLVTGGDRPGAKGQKVDGFIACDAGGDPVDDSFAKTEEGAWAKAWAALRG